MLAGAALAATAIAQTPGASPSAGLDLPANPQFLTDEDPTTRKATAIVNGHVITGTDLDQRVALIIVANEVAPPPEEMVRVRQQVLRNLIDETLQIQAAESKDIKIEQREIDAYFADYATGFGRGPKEFQDYLRTVGSSDISIKRQIHGEMAWRRLQGRQIAPFVNVAQEEVQAIIDRLNASKGQQKYRIGEIFISATPETAAEANANAVRIVQQLRQGASFAAYARQFSEASTAAVGGDLGWVSAEQLPPVLAEATRLLPIGQVSNPIPIPGGFSILVVQDARQELVADQRDAVLSLKQLSLIFPSGTIPPQTDPKIQGFINATQTMGGCGRADETAAAVGAEVISNDQVRVRELPGPLQDMLLALNVGQATTPFSAGPDRVSVLVLCGRDDPQSSDVPSFAQIEDQLAEQRIDQRARRYLRDLRRDAVVDYR